MTQFVVDSFVEAKIVHVSANFGGRKSESVETGSLKFGLGFETDESRV